VGTNGCESQERIAITAQVGELPTPTTSEIEQTFCEKDAPTILDLQVNESNILIYDQPSGSDPLVASTNLINGQTYYVAFDSGDCESSNRLAITVNIIAGKEATLEADVTTDICMGTTVTYTTESGNTNYDWIITGGEIVEGGTRTDATVSVIWNDINNAQVAVTYDNLEACGGSSSVSLPVTIIVCADLSITKTVDNPEPMIGEAITFTIQVKNDGPNAFNNLQVQEEIPSGYDFIDAAVNIGSYSTASHIWTIDVLEPNVLAVLTIRVKVLGEGEYINRVSIVDMSPNDIAPANNRAEAGTTPLCLIVYNEFSPNGDGFNDNFVISCIESFPDNSFKVFNKYGSLVYSTSNYQNQWDGTSNVSTIIDQGEILPAATYYYILDLGELGTKSGWIYLAL
jgi:gliding motility-associated-like protein/uncharacterized repeat protein (TIGR01451 family)